MPAPAVHNADIGRVFAEIAELLEIEQANPFRIRAYRNAARTGALPPLDLVVGTVHSDFHLSHERQTERILKAFEHPHFHIMAHPTGRLFERREPYDVDMLRINLRYGVGQARRGWLEKADVLNTRPLAELQHLLRQVPQNP